jgi:hypothetical protein
LLKEAVELSVTPSMRRMTACSTPPSYRDIVLPGKKYLHFNKFWDFNLMEVVEQLPFPDF